MELTTVLTGLVLAAVPIGEYDKRIVLLTKERGKISAFAKGARRSRSQLLAAANPFAFGQFEIFEGRSSYTIHKANITNYFQELRNDLAAVSYGFYFLELADYYTRENNDEVLMLKLLYQSLRALEKPGLDKRLVKCIFELKAMKVNGEYPNVFSCMSCGKESDLIGFSVKQAGVLCQDCVTESAISIDASALYTLQYIITAPIEKLYTFAVSSEVLSVLERIMGEYGAHYFDHNFKSLGILSQLNG